MFANHGSRFARILADGGRIGQSETPQRMGSITWRSSLRTTSPASTSRTTASTSPSTGAAWSHAFGRRQYHAPRRHAGAHRRRTRKHQALLRVVCAPTALTTTCRSSSFAGRPRRREPASAVAHKRWLDRGAVKHFRVVLPDQRGTGRSSCVDGRTIAALGDRAEAAGADAARTQADFLKRHLASSIVRDFEYLRLVGFGGKPGSHSAELRRLFDVELSVALPRGRGGKLYLRRHSACTGKCQRGLCAHLPAHGSQDAAVLRPLPRRRRARGGPGRCLEEQKPRCPTARR